MNHLGFVAVMAIFKIVKVMAIAVMPIELVIYISRRAKRKGCPKTAREKRIEFQHMEERQKRLWKLLERSCFAVFGIVWTATGVLAAVYGLGPYALLAFLPAAGFWAMLFSGYTAPFYYFTVICLRRQLYSRTAILIIHCPRWENVVYYGHGKTIGPKAALPLLYFAEGSISPPDERKEGGAMITYSELIQTGIFVVALVNLCYQIFKGKKK